MPHCRSTYRNHGSNNVTIAISLFHVRLVDTPQRFGPEGELEEASTQLTVSVKPGWKKGTKITFPNEGDEGPGVLPADVLLVVAER